MRPEDTSAALTTINEANASLERFTASVLGLGDPDLGAQLDLVSASTSAARGALEGILPALRPPSNPFRGLAASLPHDILAEIFKAWFQQPDGNGISYRGRSMASCYVAASVNRDWRVVALSTPSIWTRTILDLEALANIDLHIGTVLSRSKTLPLDVRCCNSPCGLLPEKTLSAGLIDKLVDVFSRCARLSLSWSALTLRRQPMRFEDTLLPLLQVPMPRLEHLSLEGLTAVAFFEDTLVDTPLLTLCPKLRSLDLGALPMHFIEIESLRLHSFSASMTLSGDSFSELNEAWPELASLDIRGVRNGRPMLFPKLQKLDCSDAGVFRCIPSPAHAPCLEYLSIVATADFHRQLGDFLAVSACTSLRVLELRTGLRTEVMAHFPRLFVSLPGLRELRLTNLDTVEVQTLFRAWSQETQQPPLLEAISLRQCSLDVAATRALVNFLTRRKRQTGRALASLSLVQQGRLHETFVVLPSWMRYRFEQLVHDLHVDVGTALEVEID